MNNAAEKLFEILDSDSDGFITKYDLIQLCDKLELEEGPDAFIQKLGFQEDERPITLDDIYRSGLFDSVGQNDVSLNLAAISENNYESIFDLLLVLQKTTTSYLRNKNFEIESELQQCTSEKDNLKREMAILLQECDERERNISEFHLREKQLKQEIHSLYDQLDQCQTRDRTNTNESFKSRLGSEQRAGVAVLKSPELANDSLKNGKTSDAEHICDDCQRLLEDITNYESIIEQLNSEKKKMNVKVHAADTYLTQVKELESAYRNLEQHTMQMSSEHDSILTEYEEMRGNYDELSQRYEELRKQVGTGGEALNTSTPNLDTSQYTNFSANNTSGGFSFADELADTESRIQVEQLQDENELLLNKIRQLEHQLHHSPQQESLEQQDTISNSEVVPQILLDSQEQDASSLPDSGFVRASPQSPTGQDGICGHVLIGTAKLFLHCLRHDIGVSYSPPIVDKHGQVFGHLKVKLQRLSSSHSAAKDNTEGTSLIGDLLLGANVTVHIGIIEATGIPSKLNNYVFCQYKFWDHKDCIQPGLEYQQHLPRTNTAVFEHQETYTVTVTQSFLNYVNDGLLSVEVWGLRMDEDAFGDSIPRTASMITTNATAPLYDRWSEMMTRLQLWVEILEINDSGIYTAVEVQQRSDLKTGGIYQLRQGLSRRILVRVLPVGASGNIACKNISSITIGNVNSQTRHQPALDSYQNEDLLKLRCAWSEALESVQNRIGEKLHRLTEKDTLSDSEEEERGKLLEEWIRLLRERDAVLLPKENSGVPGARDSRPVPQGMEARIPTLFADVNDQLRQNPKHRIVIGEGSNLSGQDPSSMIRLTTVKHDQHRVCAIAAWDSSTHETESLNCVTEPEQRVYLTLQVGVDVSLPYGMELELVLRKRVCVRIYKKKSLRDSMRGFMQDIPKRCGVMYEVVTGIPLFSNYNLDTLHKRTSTPIKEEEEEDSKEETLQTNNAMSSSDNSQQSNGLSDNDDSIDPL